MLECTILCRDSVVVPLQTRREWFRRVCKAYGRTALLLSGGAGMGYYHIGVVKALWEAKCLPSIISGASAGSLMCGFLAVRSDDEISQLFSPDCHTLFKACADPWSVKLTRWLSRGYLFDVNDWMVKLRRDFTKGDVTFAEAFSMTRRTVNITITSVSKYVPSIILNHKSTPDVIIWSAILASSAMPNIIQPVELLAKDSTGRIRPFHVHGKTWTDGTIKNDIPVKEIAAMHNANFFVVSQVNPHLIPFFYSSRGSTGRPTLYSPGSGYRGGFILSTLEKLLKLDMKKCQQQLQQQRLIALCISSRQHHCGRLISFVVSLWRVSGLQLLSELDLLPVVFGTDWRYIFLQPVSGTVTVVPSAPVSAYFRMITDPTYETLRDYIHIGESCTWPRLARISNHFRLERLLNDCKRALEAQAERQQQTGDEHKRRLLQREVREIMKEQKQKERWSSEGEGEDDADAADRSRAAKARGEEGAAGGAAGPGAEDESIIVEPVGEIDTAHPLRRASAALQSRKIERELKARVIREAKQQMETAASGRRGSTTAESDSAQQAGLASPPSARSEPPAVDAAPPIVFDGEGQAYLTDTADTDDEFDDDSLPASPLKNM